MLGQNELGEFGELTEEGVLMLMKAVEEQRVVIDGNNQEIINNTQPTFSLHPNVCSHGNQMILCTLCVSAPEPAPVSNAANTCIHERDKYRYSSFSL
jgi:hypothetical protein